PSFGARGFYVTIVRALGDRPRYLKAELMAQASDLLAAEAEERHRRVVIICDEAHLLQPDQLEELRLLTNAEIDSASPFAGNLAGQAEPRRAIADYQARHAADQQARVDALLLEAIAALAGLLGTPGPHPSRPA